MMTNSEKREIKTRALQVAELIGTEVKATFPEKETDATDKRIIVRIRMIGIEQQLHSQKEAHAYLDGMADAAIYLNTMAEIRQETA